MTLTAPGRRLAAFAVDAALALVLAGIAITPIVTFADPVFWTKTNPIPLIWVLVLILLGILNRGNTPGKRWLKLRVEGDGCIICREVRRAHWLLLLGLYNVLIVPTNPTFIAAFAIGLAFADLVLPVVRGADDLRHNTAAGFKIITE